MKQETFARRGSGGLNKSAFGAAAVALLASTLALSAQTPERGGTLKISYSLTAASLDPLYQNGGERNFLNLFAESLLLQDENYEFVPALAESWELENDGKSIVFQLREGVTFHDGTPLNAAAVKFNFDRLMNPDIAHNEQAAAAMFESVEVIDDTHVRINLVERSELAFVVLASPETAICSPDAITELGEDFGRNPVCTGPFVIDSWSGNDFVANRNPDYWRIADDGEPLPYLDSVEITIQSNSAVRMVELRSGNVQFIDYVLPKDFEQIIEDPELNLVDIGIGLHEYIAFNVSKPPFDNADLREAVALGINREALVTVVAPTSGSVLNYMESPEQLWVYDETVVGHVYDPEAARAAFERSGFDGEVSLMVIQRDPDIQVAQLLQGMLGEIGLKLNIEVVERQGFLDKMNALQHDFLIARMVHSIDPDNQYSAFFDERGVFNVTGVDRSITTPWVQAARNELDREARRGLYRQVTDSILERFIFSWLIRVPYQSAAAETLQNIRVDAGTGLIYYDLWLND